MNINRIFIIGDSFCDFLPTPKKDYTKEEIIKWNQWLTWEYPSIEIINDAFGSRDLQTILDNWIKLIPKLKSDDFLILCIPSYFRQRVPLREEDWMLNDWSSGQIKNRFVTHHSWYMTDSQKIYVDNNFAIERDELDTYINFFETLNTCKSTVENYVEVINSLYDITPCKKYLFSWDELNPSSEYIDTKSILKEKIGMWITQHELYEETNGEMGIQGDFHWDYRTEKRFFEFIKNILEQ